MTGVIPRSFTKTLLRNLLVQVYAPVLAAALVIVFVAYMRKRA